MSLSEQIAGSLKVSDAFVRKVAASANYRYKQFAIKKADGVSVRLIEQPSKELKLLQRWLVRRVFDLLPTHPCAHAYVKGRSISTNAAVHRNCRYISRLDFANFFPSLTRGDIEVVLKRDRPIVGNLPLSDGDIDLVCALTCRLGKLTIGAPSSPTISNKLMYGLDSRFEQIATSHGANYTRYADDLYFSSAFPGVLEKICSSVEGVIAETPQPRLRLNKGKTYHASRKRRMAVTGLRITPEGSISVGRSLKRKIRAAAHRVLLSHAKSKELGWLEGMLAYISSIEPLFAEKIRSRYKLG